MDEKWVKAASPNAMIPLYREPENIAIVVVGGVAGKSAAYSAYFPGPYFKPYAIKG